MNDISESDIFQPVYDFLTDMGYDVKGEVKGCDMTAVRGDELVIIELKKSFNLELVFQLIDRQKSADSVYAAIPRPAKGYNGTRWKDVTALARRLEIGLIVAAFTEAGPFVEVAIHPKDYSPPKAKSKKRRTILSEHSSRTGNQNIGGVSKAKLMTAYREQSLHIAVLLDMHGALGTKQLRDMGASVKAAAILYRNYYKWFEKQEKEYALSDNGRAALAEYSTLAEGYRRISAGDLDK